MTGNICCNNNYELKYMDLWNDNSYDKYIEKIGKTMREKLRITDSEWTRDKVMDGITGFFILLILVVHPLILNNYYSDVLETKYKLYYISMLSMFLLLLISHVFIRKKVQKKK